MDAKLFGSISVLTGAVSFKIRSVPVVVERWPLPCVYGRVANVGCAGQARRFVKI